MPATGPSRLALAAAFAAIYLIWGSNFLAIRLAVETIPPFLLMGSRSLAAGVALVAWGAARSGLRPTLREWRGATLVGAMLFLVGHGGLGWGQQHVPSGVAALVMATIPLWMVLLEWRFLKTAAPAPATWVGLVLGLLGIALLTGLAASVGGATVPLVPALALLMSAVAWAAGSVTTRLVPLPKSVALATGMQLVSGGVLLCVLALASGELRRPGTPSAVSLVAMAYMVVLASIVGFTTYVWLLRVSSPGRVATYAFVNPLVAVLVGWALGGEEMTARIGVAACFIVSAVMLIVASRSRARG